MLAYCAFKNIPILKGNKNIHKCDSFLLAKYERKRAKIHFFHTMLNKSRSPSLVSRGNEYASFSFRIMSICSIRNAIYLLSLAEDFSRGGGRAKSLLALSSYCVALKRNCFLSAFSLILFDSSVSFMLFQWFMLKQTVFKRWTLIFTICHPKMHLSTILDVQTNFPNATSFI